MLKYDVEQGSVEWHQARLGIPTASDFKRIITPTGMASKQADDYADQLLAELISGETVESWSGSSWTERGKELEPEAALFYEQTYGVKAEIVGFVTDDKRTMGCSPDRLVGDDGLLELKCCAPKTHIGYLLNPRVDREYYPQLQGQLFVTGRKWVDIMSYHPKIPPLVIRVERDDNYLFQMTGLMARFHAMMNEKKQNLISKGYMKGSI